MKRFDRIDSANDQIMRELFSGDQPIKTRLAVIENRMGEIERIRRETKVGQRAFLIAGLTFILTILGWILVVMKIL